ncbi:MAG: GTPase Era [Deltaproteobacteria bacterium]|jgi:GTP-binding protein Era|nr:GTPase Era [Deltaproteobacteria bacterium]
MTLGKSSLDSITPQDHRAGFVAIIGAPNCGKSSLLNRLLGHKLAIVTSKPQTTRNRILGVVTEKTGQIIFYDTPGIHQSQKLLNRSMVAQAKSALADSDVCLWLVDGLKRGLDHQSALESVLSRGQKPLIVAINKSDLMESADIEAILEEVCEQIKPDGAAVISAKTGEGLSQLKKLLIDKLPVSPALYDEDELTDQSYRAISAEYIREAVFSLTRQEVPYSTAVTIDSFKEPTDEDRRPLYRIEATIHVERESQKKLIIGQGGRMVKSIGTKARQGLEEFLETKVFLTIFVRITHDWSEKEKLLEEFGYLDPDIK